MTATPINGSPRPLTQRPAASVELYASSPPTRPHVDLAVLEVQQTRGLNPQGTDLMIQGLREKAGEMGCDALFLGAMTDHQGAQPGSGFDLIDPGASIRQATCIVYTSPEASPVAAGDGGVPDAGENVVAVPAQPAVVTPATKAPLSRARREF